ncbi:exodeoxyribonuclease III [Pedobacter yulinensis]|uniref:Exodeoxyribonuclease III n=1 Tax=Pedobacter yulinensis TaxID=2126353 RepID=A0A2T3HJX9_9SPHI|nr:exodeoxyribonuclease III [Pedobacter yulinensis]PST82775.1 exodeoxyribonuclease III [Pedobacter yulinensis]
MKLATFNINGINGRLHNLLRWLAEARPDVVCLQELKCQDDNFPEQAISDAGYQAIWLGQKSWNGVAILSKTGIQEVQRGLPGFANDPNSRYLEAIVNKMVIGCLYLPNGNPFPGEKFDYKLRWFRKLQAHARKLKHLGLPAALIGDFNVMPTALDVYKPDKYADNALYRPETRAAYKTLLKQGWTDAIRHLYPDVPMYTFWDYLRQAYERDAGLRLDHFLLSAPLAGRLTGAGIDRHVRGWEKASDHAPAWITLKK